MGHIDITDPSSWRALIISGLLLLTSPFFFEEVGVIKAKSMAKSGKPTPRSIKIFFGNFHGRSNEFSLMADNI